MSSLLTQEPDMGLVHCVGFVVVIFVVVVSVCFFSFLFLF